ncbi:hypothetical protein MLD38_039009 [Melastoma candidum]|uniref:Uncharacterized protein n=1 Tax=Melastoma candidum TaxID=119954 RepID=A0ACB9L1W2_9MYRT|nr:hypothetical protein MLD38_039009 [Melastoma candidum]
MEVQEEGVPDNLRKQLAVAVRSIQWSYAIFWSLSATQHGALEWRDGYYNGDIKARKTVQAGELNKPDKIRLQRSEQLRELYESLLEGEPDPQTKRPSAALSPEDLTDEEWYYLVCMSFTFNAGEGLPGRSLANNQTIWLCNAQHADGKVFSRSLLAKSASIQTVVCFPYLGGVIELGVTDLVPEDCSLLQHIKVSLLDFSKPLCSEKFSHDNGDDRSDPMGTKVDALVLETLYSPSDEIAFGSEKRNYVDEKELDMDSLDDCSNGCDHNHQTEDTFMVDDTNGGAASQVQSWLFAEDDFSNGFQGSINSSDCISEAIANHEKPGSPPKPQMKDCNHSKLSCLNLGADDISHYKRTVSSVLKNSDRVPDSLCICCHSHEDCGREHAPPTKKGEQDKFSVLRSMIPSIEKIDKASILDDTIVYLKELEARVEALESCMESAELEGRNQRTIPDLVEKTSDHSPNVNKSWVNKRKASDIDETYPELRKIVVSDRAVSEVKIHAKDWEVVIEMKCPYREYLLVDILEVINNLQLDAYSVQSSTLEGVLSLALKSKFRGGVASPVGLIKQALWKITGKC